MLNEVNESSSLFFNLMNETEALTEKKELNKNCFTSIACINK